MNISRVLNSKLLKFFAVVIVALAVFVRLSAHVMGVERYHKVIVDQISSVLDGKNVKMKGELMIRSIPILNTAKIIAQDITIKDSDDESSNEFFYAKEFVIDISLIDFMLGKIHFKSLEINEANLFLTKALDSEQHLKKNWSFVYNFAGKKGGLLNLNNISFKNSNITYKVDDLSIKLEQVNLSIIFNQDNENKLKGSFNYNNSLLNINLALAKVGQSFKMDASGDGVSANLLGEFINTIDDFQINSSLKIQLTKPSFINDAIISAAPFLANMRQINLKDPLSIQGDIFINESIFKVNNVNISSNGTVGKADLSIGLMGNQDFNIDLDFDKLDLTNFISLSTDNLVQAFANDAPLFSDVSSQTKNNKSEYINFDLIDQENASVTFNAKSIVMKNSSIQNLQFDFKTSAGSVNKGNLSFDVSNKTHSTSIKLKNLSFQKVDNVHLLLGEFNNAGKNINETFELFNIKDLIDINGDQLNYNIDSKIIFSPQEISLFEIKGTLGTSGSFTGSIASTHDDTNHYNFDMQFNNLTLADFSMPLLQERSYALLTKSGDDDYLSYFRWFRTLSSSYRFKFKFIDTEIKDKKISNLLVTSKLVPGNALFQVDIQSDFADGEYKIELGADQLKPTLNLFTNLNYLDFDSFKTLVTGFFRGNNEQQKIDTSVINTAEQGIWSDKKLNVFFINKYGSQIDLNVKDLKIGNNNLENFVIKGHTSNDVLYIDNSYFKLYDGEFQARGNISFFDQLLYQFSFNTSGMESKDIINDVFPNLSGIEGVFAATGSVISQGNSPRDIVSNLQLAINIIAPSMKLDGVNSDGIVDVALKRKEVDASQVLTTIDDLLKSGTNDITNVSGNFKSAKGILSTDNITFRTRFSQGVFAMSLDLNNFAFSSNAQFAFLPYTGNQAIAYNITKYGDLKGKLSRAVSDDSLIKYLKQQYGIVTEEDIIKAKKLLQDRRRAAEEDPESKDYLFYKLQEKLGEEKANSTSGSN